MVEVKHHFYQIYRTFNEVTEVVNHFIKKKHILPYFTKLYSEFQNQVNERENDEKEIEPVKNMFLKTIAVANHYVKTGCIFRIVGMLKSL